MAIGVSFLEGLSGGGDPREDVNGHAAQVQRAIQLLNLRLPRVAGANAIAPGALLNAPGGMPGMDSALQLQAVMRAMAGMGGPMGAPAPTRVSPGLGTSGPTLTALPQSFAPPTMTTEQGGGFKAKPAAKKPAAKPKLNVEQGGGFKAAPPRVKPGLDGDIFRGNPKTGVMGPLTPKPKLTATPKKPSAIASAAKRSSGGYRL